MSYTRPIRKKITLKISGFPEDKTDALEEFLDNSFCIGVWEYKYGLATDAYPIVAVFTEEGTETVYPGCYTMPNGDPGYPDEFEDDLVTNDCLIEEYFEGFCDKHGLDEVEYLVSEDVELV